jgi:Protein of unknown function (DUF992)
MQAGGTLFRRGLANLIVLYTALFLCPTHTIAQVQVKPIDNTCARPFPPTPLPDYSLPKIEFGIFDPPNDSRVYFLVNSSTMRQSSTTTPVFFVKNEHSGFWWTGPAKSSTDFNEYLQQSISLDRFAPAPESINSLKNSLTLRIYPTLSIGGNVYCLASKFSFTWPDLPHADGRVPDQINEEWYGTTVQSPVYAVIRVRWSHATGKLSCEVPGNLSTIINSNKEIECSFTSARGKTGEYLATINKFEGSTDKGTFSWDVFNPSEKPETASIEGTYVALDSPAEADGNVLIGGSISLQPVQGQSNLASGVKTLTLRSGT